MLVYQRVCVFSIAGRKALSELGVNCFASCQSTGHVPVQVVDVAHFGCIVLGLYTCCDLWGTENFLDRNQTFLGSAHPVGKLFLVAKRDPYISAIASQILSESLSRRSGDSFASRWASCSTFFALPWAVQSVAASSVVPTWSGHLEPTPEYPPEGLRCVFRKQQAFSAEICLSLCGSSLESWVGNEENINELQSHTIQHDSTYKII